MSLLDLAAARIVNGKEYATVKIGDIVRIIEPFDSKEDMLGIVVDVDCRYMTVFHSGVNKTIIWNRHVNCEILVL